MRKKFVVYVLAFSIVSCSDSEYINTATDDGNVVQEIPLGPPAIVVSVATSDQCVAGGSIYTFFNDANSNGSFEESENLIQRQAVCNGVAGTDGQNGESGLSLVLDTIVANSSQCSNGGNVILIANDSDRNGIFDVTDANVRSLTVCNGNNGADGSDGVDGSDGQNASFRRFTPVDMVMACGNTSPYKEVLMILHSGDVLSSFSSTISGDMTRLAFLPDGTFMNTDGSSCIFTLSTSIDGTERSISWNNSVQKTWPINP